MNHTAWVGFWMVVPILIVIAWATFLEYRSRPKDFLQDAGFTAIVIASISGAIGLVVLIIGIWGHQLDKRCEDPHFAVQDGHRGGCTSYLEEKKAA